MTPGAQGLRGPATVGQGGSVQVDIGPNDRSVQINAAGQGDTQSVPVPPGKTATIPIPPVPPGTFVMISIGNGLNRRRIIVEVIAPSP